MRRALFCRRLTVGPVGLHRWAVVSGAILMVSAVAPATVAAASSSSSSVAAVTVRPGSAWRLGDGAFCETDSFSRHGSFTGITDDGIATEGTYTRTKHDKVVTMAWGQGPVPGAVFRGRHRNGPQVYAGPYSPPGPVTGNSVTADLHPAPGPDCPQATVAPGSPTVSVDAGETDTLTLTGSHGVTPHGEVSFAVCPGDGSACDPSSSTADNLGLVSLSGSGGTASATTSFDPPAAGPYCYWARYDGSKDTLAVTEASTTDQCFTATADATEVTAAPDASSIIVGSNVVDTASLSLVNNSKPTGTVLFDVCGPMVEPAACTATTGTQVGNPASFSSSGGDVAYATSAAFTPTALGVYCFVASFSGDSHYVPSSWGSIADQCFTVSLAVPSVNAVENFGNVAVGGSETGIATVTGENGVTPSGEVDFSVCPASSDPCSARQPVPWTSGPPQCQDPGTRRRQPVAHLFPPMSASTASAPTSPETTITRRRQPRRWTGGALPSPSPSPASPLLSTPWGSPSGIPIPTRPT